MRADSEISPEILKGLLERGVAEVIVREELEKMLASGKKLRVKFGIDPTAPDLHLGHAVVLRKLRQFQDAGHQAVLIIGDFTAMIGDPSGRAGAREPLTEDEVRRNLEKLVSQAGTVLDAAGLEVRYNSQWLEKLSAKEIVQLTGKFTIQQIIQREDFAQRLRDNQPVGLHEALYPLFQAYDSVAVEADVEIGGVDQKLNLIAGRHLMGKMGMKPQQIVLVPLLKGTDGARKMSKSFGNYIGLGEEPNEMFGKIMTVPDKLVPQYYEWLTDVPMPLEQHPRDVKLGLARIIVEMYHNEKTAENAANHFINVFSRKEKPEQMPELRITDKELGIMELLLIAGIKSKSEARRLIEQGGVKIDASVKRDVNEIITIADGATLQIGRRKFFRIGV